MKTITEILFYTFILCFFAIQTPALAQVPLPTDCGDYPMATASGIHYKVNGINYPANGSKFDSEYMKFNQSRIIPGSKLEMYFNTTNAPGRYTLVSYIIQDDVMEIFDYESIVFPIGNSNILTVKIPHCNFAVYFIKGCVENSLPTTDLTNPFSNGAEVYDYAFDLDNGPCDNICEITSLGENYPDPDNTGIDLTGENVVFRLIEIHDNGDGTSNIIFSVINWTMNYLIGDITLTTPNALPSKNNIPYQFRYDYQIDNTPTSGMVIKFDQRNNHNNHIYDNLQSELIIFPVNNSDLEDEFGNPLEITICAELDGKHPEPKDTPGPELCATFQVDCGQEINEPCVKQKEGIRVELLDFTSIAGNQTPLPFKITNLNSGGFISVDFSHPNYLIDNVITNPTADVYSYTTSVTTQGAAPTLEVLNYTGNPAPIAAFSGGNFDTFRYTVGTTEFLQNLGEVRVTVTTEDGTVTFDPFFAGECGSIIPLPVEFTTFKGQLMNDKSIKLMWQTASEENNDHFEIERSDNGKDFVAIGMVKGNGTTKDAHEYAFADITPMRGVNYYRLRQVDTDGKFEFSKIVAVNSEAQGSMSISMVPNPCMDGNCIVQVSNLSESEATVIELRDMTGRLLYSQNVDSSNQNYTLSTQDLHLDKGIYILSARSGNTRSIDKIVIK